MDKILELLKSQELLPALPKEEAVPLAEHMRKWSGLDVYWRSIVIAHGALFFLGRRETRGVEKAEKRLGILYSERNAALDLFIGPQRSAVYQGVNLTLRLCPPIYDNATALHLALPFTRPRTLDLQPSAGCGDRLGLATPGHVRAIRNAARAEGILVDIAPIFAQQSIREMERSGRKPKDVINDATWGVFQEGWRSGYGADADHLKTESDIDICVQAGFTFFTFDPRDHVDNQAQIDPRSTLEDKVAALPWRRLEDDWAAMRERYREDHAFGGIVLQFDDETVLRAAAKYGRALAHVSALYRHLDQRMGDSPFEVEVSVDETDTTTSAEEHFFIATELARLGVHWVSLAPRYVGRFEKGVDYIGDLHAFEKEMAKHAAIARRCGPYKLSIHSGSDKFSIYPIVAKHTKGLFHLKTAGTSYLEALRAIATIDPPLFRRILDFARERYDTDKATYHVSADPTQAPRATDLQDDELASVLEDFHARQMLHVTFGSVLTARDQAGRYIFRDQLLSALRTDEEAYYQVLETHFDRHLSPFVASLCS